MYQKSLTMHTNTTCLVSLASSSSSQISLTRRDDRVTLLIKKCLAAGTGGVLEVHLHFFFPCLSFIFIVAYTV